jgi:hypothetical protein
MPLYMNWGFQINTAEIPRNLDTEDGTEPLIGNCLVMEVLDKFGNGTLDHNCICMRSQWHFQKRASRTVNGHCITVAIYGRKERLT